MQSRIAKELPGSKAPTRDIIVKPASPALRIGAIATESGDEDNGPAGWSRSEAVEFVRAPGVQAKEDEPCEVSCPSDGIGGYRTRVAEDAIERVFTTG